jgi:ABC-type nickel/cobalt efflux system permease component RcnA
VSDFLTLGTAAMLGMLHAFEVDHMLAVTTFVSRRPAIRAAAGFGARWGVGHSLAVLAAGGLLLATGFRWPARYDAAGEALVGLMLLGLGVWALWSARQLHLHSAAEHGGHAHVHLHGPAGRHAHRHEHAPGDAGHTHDHGGITLVGLLHGLAGTSAVVALVPVTLLGRLSLGVGYLLCFGLGVTVGMTVFAVVAAAAMREAAERSLVWGRRAAQLVGASGVAVGAWWIVRAL